MMMLGGLGLAGASRLLDRAARGLGSRSGASKRLKKAASEGGAVLPIFLAPSQLEYLSSTRNCLTVRLSPLTMSTVSVSSEVMMPSVLTAVCDIWLRAREAKALQQQQLGKAQKAEILTRALAHTGTAATSPTQPFSLPAWSAACSLSARKSRIPLGNLRNTHAEPVEILSEKMQLLLEDKSRSRPMEMEMVVRKVWGSDLSLTGPGVFASHKRAWSIYLGSAVPPIAAQEQMSPIGRDG